jgi:hypothetical protein
MAQPKVESLIKSPLENIGIVGLKKLKSEYLGFIKGNPFPVPPSSGDVIDMIFYLKRKNQKNVNTIGPYKNITVFEAANRIASDLVIIYGLIQMIENEKALRNCEVSLKLGTKHVEGEGDFLINGKHGEAFNVANSYYPTKLAKTISNWDKKPGKLHYILVNGDVVLPSDIERLKRKKIKLIPVAKWH